MLNKPFLISCIIVYFVLCLLSPDVQAFLNLIPASRQSSTDDDELVENGEQVCCYGNQGRLLKCITMYKNILMCVGQILQHFPSQQNHINERYKKSVYGRKIFIIKIIITMLSIRSWMYIEILIIRNIWGTPSRVIPEIVRIWRWDTLI
jgi:hypothetical protein